MHADDCLRRKKNVARKIYGKEKEYMVEERF
jgi:hypothetical protein